MPSCQVNCSALVSAPLSCHLSSSSSSCAHAHKARNLVYRQRDNTSLAALPFLRRYCAARTCKRVRACIRSQPASQPDGRTAATARQTRVDQCGMQETIVRACVTHNWLCLSAASAQLTACVCARALSLCHARTSVRPVSARLLSRARASNLLLFTHNSCVCQGDACATRESIDTRRWAGARVLQHCCRSPKTLAIMFRCRCIESARARDEWPSSCAQMSFETPHQCCCCCCCCARVHSYKRGACVDFVTSYQVRHAHTS